MNNRYSDITSRGALFIAGGIIILALLCFATYGEILGYYFTSIDSFPLLVSSKIDSWRDIGKVFSTPLGGGFPFGSYYRPVSELTYGFDSLIWGKDPFGYHLTDILLHLINSIIVFLAASILFRNYNRGLFAAWTASVLFLLSPLNMSVITTMERRQDMVMAMMFSLSLLVFGKAQKTESISPGWYLFSLMLGFFAVFSKESAFVLPVIVWALSFIFNGSNNYLKRAMRATKYCFPFFGFVFLNAMLHLYFFGQWDVRTSSGIPQNAIAMINSFFTFAGPLEFLKLPMTGKKVLLLLVLIISFAFLSRVIAREGLQGVFDFFLNEERRIYTFLLSFVLTFLALFTLKGTSHDFYHYLPNMALTVLVVLLLIDTFNTKWMTAAMKSIGVLFLIYIVLYSPVFSDYNAWRDSSDITREVINETRTLLESDREASRIYLINWPGFIGTESDISGANSTILVSYSMTAWAEWAGLRSSRDLEFIHISYTSFPSGSINAKFDYSIADNTIETRVTGCRISPSKVPYKGELPFEFKVNEENTHGRLSFNRKLRDNERLFLYDISGLKVVNRDSMF